MISNSGSDERKKYSGGQAGDQTGREWAIIPWYNRPWNCVLRHPDPKVRNEIALMGERAANNNNIGYDQGQRWTYWQELAKVGYDPAAIKTPCESDCSCGVLSNVKAVGYRLNIQQLKNVNQNGYTGNQKAILKQAGFEVLTESKYLTSDRYLLRGDILLNEGHHTATNLTTGSAAGGSTSAQASVPSSSSIGNVATGQKWLNSTYGNIIRKYKGALLKVDNSYGTKSKEAALCVWKHLMNENHGSKLTLSNSNFGDTCKAEAKKALLKSGSTGPMVYIAQFILSAKGFYSKGMDADFGGGTKNAVISFQNRYGLEADGQIGQNTWYKLFNC